MERTHRKSRRLPGVATVVASAVALAGCGDQKNYVNNPRPAAPITISAYISAARVSVSPSSFGAGPITVLVTNESSTSQEATFETGSGGSGLTQSTGPINPGDTGEIKLFVRQGVYRLRASSDSIAPATMSVGRKRPSAQNEVLQP